MSAKHRKYNPINEDHHDCKIPLYSDDAFEHGIQFHTKVKVFRRTFNRSALEYLVYRLDGGA